MRVGIIGSGQIGGTVAGLLTKAGHQAALSNTRGRESLLDLVARLGPNATAVSIDDAIEFAGTVVLAIPYSAFGELPAGQLANKTIVDTTNFMPTRDAGFDDIASGARTSSEVLAEHLDQSVVVKAVNTLNYAVLRDQSRPAGARDRLALPYAGDDAEAKQRVASMIDDMGFDPIDAGPLDSGGRLMQPGSELFNRPLTAADVRAILRRSRQR